MKIRELQELGNDPVIVDAGDLLFSTKNINSENRRSEVHRAKSIIEGFNKIGCDAINVGQYEMLNGLKFLKELSEDSNIPFISANIKDSKTSKLIFSPYHVVVKNQLKFGIIGVTDLLPDTCKTIISDNFIDAGNNYVKELADKADFLIMLVNANRDSQKDIASKFPGVDFIITSGSTNMSRANSPQKENGPYFYSCGKQGKHLLFIEGNVTDPKHPLVDISSHQKKISDIKKRFDRLQKKDPEKSLEKIYSDQQNILKLIKQYRADLENSNNVISNAVNTLTYSTIALNSKIKDDPELLAFVDASVKTCNRLDPTFSKVKNKTPKKKQNSKNPKLKKQSIKNKIGHSGHNH